MMQEVDLNDGSNSTNSVNSEIVHSENITMRQHELFYYRRPELNTEGFQRTRSRLSKAKEKEAPALFVTPNGTPKLGFIVTKCEDGDKTNDDAIVSRQNPDKLARLLVLTNSLNDPITAAKIRHVQFAFLIVSCAGIVLTLALLFPDGKEAWYSAESIAIVEGPVYDRIQYVRPYLLALGSLVSCFGVFAIVMKDSTSIQLYISAHIATDVMTLVFFMPHMFFVLRLLFDVLHVILAVETKKSLEHTWFVTNFRRVPF